MPVRTYNRTITQAAITLQGAAGSTDLVAAPGAGLRIYVVQIYLTLDAAGTLQFTEGTGPTALTGVMTVGGTNGPFQAGQDDDNPVLQTLTANAKLSLVTVTGKAAGFFRYFVDA